MTMKEKPNVSSKEIYFLNGLRIETDPLAVEEKERDGYWNSKSVDDFFMDNRTQTRNFREKEFQNGLIYPRRSLNEDVRSLFSDTNPKPSSQDHELPMTVKEIPVFRENKIKDSNFYTGKNVLECDTPDLMITCYKDNDCHAVKDICIDEGMPVKGKVSTEIREDYMKGTSTDEFEMPESPSESSRDKDLMQKAEMNSAETDETLSDDLARYSLVDRTRPTQEFGTWSSLGSLNNSIDGERNEVVKLPDQKVSSGKRVFLGPDASSPEKGQKEDMEESSLSHDSNVGSKSVTISPNFLPPEKAGISNHIIEQYADSTDVIDGKNSNSQNPSHSSQVHCNGISNTSIEKVHEGSLKAEDGFPDGFSPSNQDQCISLREMMMNTNADDQLLADHKDENVSHDFDLHVLNVNNDSFANQERYEPSLSGADFITNSGPVAVPGNVSFRSDGSATSGRSFAFPILQSEWNSSPVRMRKAGGGHFRKYKCWRTSLLCCKF